MEPTQPQPSPKSSYLVPIAIVAAGALVAGALYITRGTPAPTDPNSAGNPVLGEINIRPVDNTDHINGDPAAPILIVEYSDTECPFCKAFHETMLTIMEDYGKDGKVAWVYRHFPLYKGQQPLHSNAGKQAEATECAAELGGNDAFWKFVNRIYEVTPSNNGLVMSELPNIAEYAGINRAEFERCLSSGRYAEKISNEYDEAVAAGADGTPYSVILTRQGNKVPLRGAQPYSMVKQVLDTLLKLAPTETE